MSKYTTEVRWICEYEANKVAQAEDIEIPEGIDGIETILTLSAPNVFNFNFPIFDENYRLTLEKKILKHFYTREICEETVGLWKLRLWDKLNVIMPYYNKLYSSELLNFNPFYDVDLTSNRSVTGQETNESVANENYQVNGNENRNKNDSTSGNRESISDKNNQSESNTQTSETNSNTRTASGNTTDDNVNWTLFSDTPQGGVVLVDNTDPETVSGNAYLTTAQKITDNGHGSHSDTESSSGNNNVVSSGNRNDVGHDVNSENVSSNANSNEVSQHSNIGESHKNISGNINNTETYIEHVSGKRGGHTYSGMLLEFRKTLLNIDQMILRDLEDLFFGLW